MTYYAERRKVSARSNHVRYTVGDLLANAKRGNEPTEKEIAALVLWLNEIAAISRGENVPRLRRMVVRFRPARSTAERLPI